MTHPTHDGNVAIGNKRNLFRLFRPIIVVLHDHDPIASAEFILTVEHGIADTLVVDVGALVATRHNHRLVNTRTAITGGKTLYELVAGHHLDILKSFDPDLRQ